MYLKGKLHIFQHRFAHKYHKNTSNTFRTIMVQLFGFEKPIQLLWPFDSTPDSTGNSAQGSLSVRLPAMSETQAWWTGIRMEWVVPETLRWNNSRIFNFAPVWRCSCCRQRSRSSAGFSPTWNPTFACELVSSPCALHQVTGKPCGWRDMQEGSNRNYTWLQGFKFQGFLLFVILTQGQRYNKGCRTGTNRSAHSSYYKKKSKTIKKTIYASTIYTGPTV